VQEEIFDSESSDHHTYTSERCFISPRLLSGVIGVGQATLAAWRRRGIGPRWYQIQGHLIRYDRAEVFAWVLSQKNGPTPASHESNVEPQCRGGKGAQK
jgi:hypothetical protein